MRWEIRDPGAYNPGREFTGDGRVMSVLRRAAQLARDLRVWRLENAKLVYDQLVYRNRNFHQPYTDHDHLLAAVRWLTHAQDVMTDGGVGGRYHPGTGWTSSYPETTGYIIPTFLALAESLGDPQFVTMAERAIAFLLWFP